jgi:hypothetical protein
MICMTAQACQVIVDFSCSIRHKLCNSMKKNPHAVALGRKGGKKGGPARAAKLTPELRKEIARKAAAARWAKTKKAP